jgi:hypothetical protein
VARRADAEWTRRRAAEFGPQAVGFAFKGDQPAFEIDGAPAARRIAGKFVPPCRQNANLRFEPAQKARLVVRQAHVLSLLCRFGAVSIARDRGIPPGSAASGARGVLARAAGYAIIATASQ